MISYRIAHTYQQLDIWQWNHVYLAEKKGRKADSTLRSSQAVPHPSTDRALRCLTSEVKRDPVHSTRYGRRRQLCMTIFNIYLMNGCLLHHYIWKHVNFLNRFLANSVSQFPDIRDIPETLWRTSFRNTHTHTHVCFSIRFNFSKSPKSHLTSAVLWGVAKSLCFFSISWKLQMDALTALSQVVCRRRFRYSRSTWIYWLQTLPFLGPTVYSYTFVRGVCRNREWMYPVTWCVIGYLR